MSPSAVVMRVSVPVTRVPRLVMLVVFVFVWVLRSDISVVLVAVWPSKLVMRVVLDVVCVCSVEMLASAVPTLVPSPVIAAELPDNWACSAPPSPARLPVASVVTTCKAPLCAIRLAEDAMPANV